MDAKQLAIIRKRYARIADASWTLEDIFQAMKRHRDICISRSWGEVPALNRRDSVVVSFVGASKKAVGLLLDAQPVQSAER